MCKSVMICLAILASASAVLAQTGNQPKSCVDATGLDFNNTQFAGYWQEVARNPASNVSCIDVNIGFWNNTNMLVNVSHSANTQSLYQNVYEKANISLSGKTSYNVSFTDGQRESFVTIKLLELVSDTYLLGCSYTDASNVSTSAGFILARANYSSSLIPQVNANASVNYSNFVNGTVHNVTHIGCYASSAAQNLPLITGFLALALLLIKA
ncbi:uncharacterized protein [Drosophila kikkawai]|uniref:Uncharacterized protein n=1 Tax=Drosophila kikkawai TaxID=30033 RepID=A0A6P4IS53_DROKI|nr:uncharacterized protein LOC108080928 [Drosophila kikkawai]KAH8347438.1 hypothetical protein KR059_010734 [Drosophila kikkawai]